MIPGTWEFELIEIKSPGSVWNPSLSNQISISSEHEGYDGRTSYAKETAGAAQKRRILQIKKIDSALNRIDNDEYGFCINCGEEISQERLKQDLATAICIDCARSIQTR